jgi:hypothetical protein
MTFRIFVVYPPDREGRVAQLTVEHEDMVDIPAELSREDGELTISLFSRSDGVAWEYRLSEFLAAIDAGVAALERPSPESRGVT